MKTSLKTLGLVATLTIVASGLAVPVAAQDESMAPAAEMTATACLLAPASTTPYSSRINKQIQDYGAEKGIEVTVLSAERMTQRSRSTRCVTASPWASDGIVLIANDMEALCPVLQEAKDAGIPVLTCNAGVSCTDLVEGFTGPNYTLQAQIMGKYTCDTLLPDGDVQRGHRLRSPWLLGHDRAHGWLRPARSPSSARTRSPSSTRSRPTGPEQSALADRA